MATTRQGKHSVDERRARGKEARAQAPVTGHAEWVPAADRPDPVGLLEEQNVTREADLVPVRHGRMMASAFTFYRGAAKIMAADLKDTPTAGLTVQLCGDAHLSNFGFFASPERALVFDLNDFDETLPGPFEYDVKRMAASFTIAARNNAYSTADVRAATSASVRAYREAMAEFAQMRTMDVWYAHLSDDEMMTAARATAAKKDKKQAKALQRAEKTLQKARTRDSLQALSKLGELVDGRYQIVSQPPVVVPARELALIAGLDADEVEHLVREQFRTYRRTLQPDRRHLLERFEVIDFARKVVGVGSVGTRAFIVLLQGRDQEDPLFLQEGGLRLGARRPPAQEPVRPARRAGGARTADDAGHQRHLPGLDQRRRRQPPLLLAPAARHEGLGRGRDDGAVRPQLLRRHLRVDAGPGARPVG